ncbi:hypothetical protein BDV95DRAFT_52716 [Massariosphaeria phaeospora]|uniref:Uncharacterized protein n=1 Tax=Massariosphaeria phaeospora TaxID=100035 RepID=A0A7C8I763_9PLEO|nr:hypothetical protein BDV95DRAFT_52716 [Massariosphaeria phaeospora]
MYWSTLFVAVTSFAAASVSADFVQGVPPSPYPDQALKRRVVIDATKACADADDKDLPRNIQLASWVECKTLSFYPYPRTPAANDTDWKKGYYETFHPSLRASFNNTRYDYTTFVKAYEGFSAAISQNYGTGWQQWRDFYVASPHATNVTSRGGVVISMGVNGGILRGQTEANNYPNAGYWIVEEINDRRWVTVLTELSTSPAQPLVDGGQWAGCETPKKEL